MHRSVVSVIIPTFNEEKNIRELVPYLYSCYDSENMEIIVCDSPQSNDDLSKLADELKFKLVRSTKAYRAFQLNFGATHASNDILYFLHADARPPKTFVASIFKSLKSGNDFGIFCYKFDSVDFLLKVNSFFTKYDGVFAGGGDQSLFIKKEKFEALNGYDNDLQIMEDFDLYKRAKKASFSYTIIREALTLSARKYTANSWIKVNWINLRIFYIFLKNGSQEKMLSLQKKLIK